MKHARSASFLAALCAAFLATSCAIPGVVSSATMGKAGLAIGGAAAGAATGLIDLNDGKIAGVVPVEKLAPEMRKIGVPEFMISQVEEHARIAKLRGVLSSNDVLVVSYLLKSTGQIIDPLDVGMDFQVKGRRDARLPTVPDIGIPTRIAPASATVPGAIVSQPATPATPPPSPVAAPLPASAIAGGVCRTYSATLKIIKLDGPVAAIYSGLTATAELSVTASAETWSSGIGTAVVDLEIIGTDPTVPGAEGTTAHDVPARILDGRLEISGTQDGVAYTVGAYGSNGWSNLVLGASATASAGPWAIWATNAEANGTAVMTSVRVSEAAVETVATTVVQAVAVDALDLTGVELLGTHARKRIDRAPITRKLTKADVAGGEVELAFDPLNWSTETGGNGKTIDGGVWIFWREGGKTVGGLFDHHGLHQTRKTLGNIFGGYLEGHKPPKGATVWFCLGNREISQRTNVVASQTPWKGEG